MTNRIFLHIGTEKTGTTTLQEFLTYNCKQLESQGFSYLADPSKPYFSRTGHFPVVACLLDYAADFVNDEKKLTLHTVLDSLAADIAATKNDIILSAEHFSSRLTSKEPLEKLRSAFGERKVFVVVYIRNLIEFVLAGYSTGILCGSKEAFLAEQVEPENPYFNMLSMLRLWESVFGTENMIVKLFDRSKLINGDIQQDFCALLGVDTAELVFRIHSNQSLDASQLATLRFINEVFPTFEESPAEWQLAGAIRDIVIDYLPPGTALKKLLTQADQHKIHNRFYVINQEIERDFLFQGALLKDSDSIITSEGQQEDGYLPDDVELLNNLRTCLIGVTQKFLTLRKAYLEENPLAPHLQAALDEITALHNSTCWRITAPLRFLGRIWRYLRERGK